MIARDTKDHKKGYQIPRLSFENLNSDAKRYAEIRY
jgi:hypothetical protein